MTGCVKTLSIKNFKGVPNVSEEVLDKQCRKLEFAITAILNAEKLEHTLEELYGIVENVHSHRKNTIFENLHSLFENILIKKLEELLKENEIINQLDNTWRAFCVHVQTIKNISLCLDKSSKNKYNSIYLMAMNLFKNMIVLHPSIKKSINDEIFQLIAAERNGTKINCNLLKSIISMFTDLQTYEESFQIDFLKLTENFYKSEGNLLIDSFSISNYLEHIDRRIFEEIQRSKMYLHKYTGAATLEIVHKYLIKDHITAILDKGFNYLIENNFIKELSLMYTLFKKIPTGVKNLAEYFTTYILKFGTTLVSDHENDKNMIKDLLILKEKMDNIVVNCFGSNDLFYDVIRTSFVKFINIRKNKLAQLLAKFVDSKLRSKEFTDSELEKIFDKVMVIFRFIQGKDIFEAFYKRDLAKRLLLGKSTSQDAEDSMIAKLKNECGDNFTSKIEGMFKDISISRSVNSAFKQHIKNMLCSGEIDTYTTDLCINVLTNSFWPNYPAYEVNLPLELMNYQVAFQKFYAYNHSGRKLVWQPSLGHCVVKAVFECGNKELQVSLFQTIVLLLFNSTNKISYSEIQELTNLDINELKRTLLSLACGKSRVLLKDPKGLDIKDDDMFCLNHEFQDKLFRVKINQIQLKETAEEEKAIESSVLVDRQFQIDAAIVRIMKKRMSINHNALLAELFNTLDIPVKPHDLKKRIELLIEREYMERDKDNPANYTYIA